MSIYLNKMNLITFLAFRLAGGLGIPFLGTKCFTGYL